MHLSHKAKGRAGVHFYYTLYILNSAKNNKKIKSGSHFLMQGMLLQVVTYQPPKTSFWGLESQFLPII